MASLVGLQTSFKTYNTLHYGTYPSFQKGIKLISSPSSAYSFRSKIKTKITAGVSRPHQNRNSIKRSVRVQVYDPQARVDFPLQDEEEEEISEISVSPPPTKGRLEIVIDKDIITKVDLSPAHAILRPYVARLGDNSGPSPCDPRVLLDRSVGFTINYKLDDPLDPRELSELSDVRIWFVRLDDAYPWLPAVLDWRGGELARYSAMLVPHQMSRRSGLVFNPEALELWTMRKFFTVYEWMRARGLPRPDARVKDMMKLLGFSIDDVLYKIMEESPPPT